MTPERRAFLGQIMTRGRVVNREFTDAEARDIRRLRQRQDMTTEQAKQIIRECRTARSKRLLDQHFRQPAA
ncbi:hypothetical protein [Sphingobium baderi]|uniref:Uncharacterized protein n=1 Tax=Sphingobium baderi LL03 TaxID=1114964 RepID=T0FZN7_9SPHN|nr:hypothetical protein [Sphingobium baderi]EQA96820.1 hypothetical protein L485_22315 [Sphingobium baderi LL03]KMS64023.1 hypothetical protein V475_23215 [Sphingobium baderi LL03]